MLEGQRDLRNWGKNEGSKGGILKNNGREEKSRKGTERKLEEREGTCKRNERAWVGIESQREIDGGIKNKINLIAGKKGLTLKGGKQTETSKINVRKIN